MKFILKVILAIFYMVIGCPVVWILTIVGLCLTIPGEIITKLAEGLSAEITVFGNKLHFGVIDMSRKNKEYKWV